MVTEAGACVTFCSYFEALKTRSTRRFISSSRLKSARSPGPPGGALCSPRTGIASRKQRRARSHGGGWVVMGVSAWSELVGSFDARAAAILADEVLGVRRRARVGIGLGEKVVHREGEIEMGEQPRAEKRCIGDGKTCGSQVGQSFEAARVLHLETGLQAVAGERQAQVELRHAVRGIGQFLPGLAVLGTLQGIAGAGHQAMGIVAF